MRIRRSLNRLDGEFEPVNQTLEAIREYFDSPSEALKQILLESLKGAIKSLHVKQKQEIHIIAQLSLIQTILLSRIAIPVFKEDSCR